MSERVGTHTHDPNERLDYTIDWSRALDEGDTITGTPAWTVSPTGPDITTPSPSNTTTTTTSWFSGGTVGVDYQLEVTATTLGGRILQGHLLIRVR